VNPTSTKGSAEQVTAILEAVLQNCGQAVERSQIRRVASDAFTSAQEARRDDWWRPAIETTQSLGLKAKVIDCNFAQFIQLAREGAALVTLQDSDTWNAVIKVKSKKFLLVYFDGATQSIWLRKNELSEQLKADKTTIRCIVIEPGNLEACPSGFAQANSVLIPGDNDPTHGGLEPDGRRHKKSHHDDHQSPSKLLWRLLRPEWSDIWIVVLFAMVAGVLSLATPLAIESLVNTVAFGNVLQPVVVLSVILLAFLLFLAAIKALQTYVVEIIQRRLFARVVADLAYRLPRAEIDSFGHHEPRELVNRFFEIVTVQKVTASMLLDGVSLVISTLVGMAVLAFYHPWLLGFDIVLLVAGAVIIFVLGRGGIRTSIDESYAKYATAAWLQDIAGNTKTFRHYGGVEFAMERADRFTHQYLTDRRLQFNILMRQILFALLLQALASTALLGIGGFLVISGQLTLGQLVAAELIVTVIVSSLAKLGKHLEEFYDLMASMDKLGYLFSLPVAEQSGLLSLQTGKPASVEIVNLAYVTPHGHDVLNHVNLMIGAGEHWAITGPSSSGKSTLLSMLFGLKVPTQGHLTIDRFDPRDVRPDVLRRHVSLVSEVEIFTGTLAENLHLQRPDVTMPQLRDALEHVGLLDEILKLPDGLETSLITGGSPLTQNQSRRLMLARAIVARPGLLLIDEVLDALPDEEAERIMSYLIRPDHPWTLILVTGRKQLASMCEYRLRLMGHTAVPEMSSPRLIDATST
jgi:putative ABC transport system ATP-binding protein